MTMPLSNSPAFPIEVTEDQQQFLVKIHPSQKERASQIPSRRWNPELKRWVYPRSLITYQALKDEFQRDASVFSIRKPASKRLPKPAPESPEEDSSLEEWRDMTEKTSVIHEKFSGLEEQISMILGTVQGIEKSTSEALSKLEASPPSASADTPKPQPDPTKDLDPSKRNDLKLIEHSLILVAFQTSGRDRSFANWIKKMNPLLQPQAFVTETHEKLAASLVGILGDADNQGGAFHKLVRECNERQVFPQERKLNIPQVLYAMNQHRNRFGHPDDFPESERLSRSVIYLFNLALIWPHVASEPTEDDDET